MKTALDIDATKLDDDEKDFVENVRAHGWFGTHIPTDDEGPGFSYTTGFWYRFQFPEIILFSLPSEVAHQMFWNLFDVLAAGGTVSVDSPVSDVLDDYDVVLKPVVPRHIPEFLTWTRWFYGEELFEAQQLLWPDKFGNFPFDKGANQSFRLLQPSLTEQLW